MGGPEETPASQASPSDMGADGAIDRYRGQLASIDAKRELLRATDRRFGYVRVVLFLAFVLLLFVGMLWDDVSYATWVGWGTFALFLVAVTANEPIRDKLEELKQASQCDPTFDCPSGARLGATGQQVVDTAVRGGRVARASTRCGGRPRSSRPCFALSPGFDGGDGSRDSHAGPVVGGTG